MTLFPPGELSSSHSHISPADTSLTVFQSLDWLGRCPTAFLHDEWAVRSGHHDVSAPGRWVVDQFALADPGVGATHNG